MTSSPVETTAQADSLKIVIVGHVDNGKSTLIGRLFYDTNSLPEGKVESIQAACKAEGMEFEYAFLLDALLEEQEQNITIDTTQIHFRTEQRNYIIVDAPGHTEFLKNMITGAANADAAILLVDAQEGMQEQTRRHGYLLSLLGIRQIIVAINKMDLVQFSRQRFKQVELECRSFLDQFGIAPTYVIPIAAKKGVNIVTSIPELEWYKGPSILSALDSFKTPASRDEMPLRFVVQDIYRFDERRIVAGKIEAGTVKVGDTLVFWPNRKRSSVKTIEAWPHAGSLDQVGAGSSVAVTLTEQIFVERGQIATHANESVVEGREFQTRLFWLHDEPLEMNRACTLRLGTQSVEASVVQIRRVIDSSTLVAIPEKRTHVARHEVAEVTIRTRHPIAFDNSDRLMETGRFVLLQNGRIGGGGVIHGSVYPDPSLSEVKSENLTWTSGKITAQARAKHLGHLGGVIWFTGLSGSGKSTLAVALEALLFSKGKTAFVMDGDNLRHGLCSDLGFSAAERSENIRRAGEVARLMAEAGLIVIVSLISPFKEEREKVRQACANSGIEFAEVFINASLAECERRDPRKLYQKARAGEIHGFTGIDSPYEPPTTCELELRTDQLSVDECLELLIKKIER